MRFALVKPQLSLTIQCWSFQGRIPAATLEFIRALRSRLPTAKVSVEVEKPGRDGLTKIAAEADVVFYSRAWAEVGSALCNRYLICSISEQVHFTVPWIRVCRRVSERRDSLECVRGGLFVSKPSHQLLTESSSSNLALCTWGSRGAWALSRVSGALLHSSVQVTQRPSAVIE